MISVVHRPEPTQSAPAIRVFALVTLTWMLVGAPAGVAEADACAYASTGPDGTQAVAVAGSLTWPTPPPCSPP
ncbi:proline-rich protein, partial [Streptomyces resistomycificus]